MTIKKLNKKKIVFVVVAFFMIVCSIIFVILDKNKKQSIEYKLEAIGYSEIKIEEIKKKFNDNEINKLLNMKYSEYIIPMSKEKFFKFDKLNNYLKFYENNKEISIGEVIMKVNTHTEKDFYDEIFDTDISKKELMIVNKVYKIKNDYIPNDLKLISSVYAYSEKYISESIYDNVINLIDNAKENGYSLVVTQGYRSFIDQENAYNTYKMNYGISEADTYVARPGHSDYQTGLALIIEPYNNIVKDISNSPEYLWITENADKYGFILRYPQGKEKITGFQYDPWRLRYVGIECAKYIKENSISFEEYYGYIEE